MATTSISASLDANAAIEQTNPFGRAQIAVIFVSSFSWLLGAQQFAVPVFIARSPSRKIVSCPSNTTMPCEIGTLLGKDEGCDTGPDAENALGVAWTFTEPKNYIVTTEWELICDRRMMVAMIGSIYFAGILAGNLLLAPVPDMIGRTRAFCISGLICVLGSTGCAISHNLSEYLIARFVLGFGLASNNSVAWIAASEAVSATYKSKVIVIMNLAWSLGIIMLVPIAVWIPTWRRITMVLVVLQQILLFLGIFFWCIGIESPQWLAGRGDAERFVAVMAKIARVNGRIFASQDTEMGCEPSQLEVSANQSGDPPPAESEMSFRSVLCKCPWALYTLSFSLSFISCSMGYYGLSLNSGNIGSNIYMSLFFSGIGEIPGVLILPCLSDSPKLGRKGTLMGSLAAAGACCIAGTVLPQQSLLLVFVASFGKTCVSIAYGVVFLFSAEVYPALVRGFATGIFQTASRISGMLVPVVVALPPPMPLLLIGIGVAASALPVMVLPETLPKPVVHASESANTASPANQKNKGVSLKQSGHLGSAKRYAHLDDDAALDNDLRATSDLVDLPVSILSGSKLGRSESDVFK